MCSDTVGALLSDKRAHDCIPAVSVCAVILGATLIFLNSTPPWPFSSSAYSLETLFLHRRLPPFLPPAHSAFSFLLRGPQARGPSRPSGLSPGT